MTLSNTTLSTNPLSNTTLFSRVCGFRPAIRNLSTPSALCTLFSSFALCAPPVAFSAEKLEEVVVISSGVATPLREVATSVSVINQDAIELRGFTSLGDILRTDVGVASSNAGGLGQQSTLRIRGEEGYRTLVLIDGIDITDPTPPQSAPQLNHLMTGNNIERVEILRGPQGFIYGADAGGVISISTHVPKQGSQFRFFNETGRYATQTNSASWAVGSDNGGIYLSLDDVSSDGFNARTDDELGEEDGYENTTEHAKIQWRGDNREAQLVLRHTAANTEYDQCYTPAFSVVNDCTSDFNQALGKLSIKIDSGDTQHEINLNRSETKSKFYTEGVESRRSNGAIEKAQYIAAYDFTEEKRIIYGAELKTEEMQSEGALSSRDQLSIFSELQASFSENIFLTVGSRFDDNEDYGEHVSSRVSLAYIQEAGETTVKYRSSMGNGFRAPSLYELNYNENYGTGDAATIELNEEKSQGADIGMDVYLPNNAVFSFVYFNQEVSNQIEFDLAAYSGYLQVPGKSTSRGIEVTYEMPLTPWLNLRANSTYNNAVNDAGEPRARRPKHLGNLSFIGTFFDDSLRLNFSGRTARDAVGADANPLDDYTVVDLSAQYYWSENITMHARINNLHDQSYEEVRGYFSSGRAFYAGIRIEL